MSHIAKSKSYKPTITIPSVPPQAVRPPLRVPRSKTAAMMLIQQLSRDHHHWTRGVVSHEKLPRLVTKMDTKFCVLAPARTRTRMRSQGVPTGRMIVWRQPHTDRWLWWCLVAGRDAQVHRLTSEYRETLLPVHGATPLPWADEYELRRGPRGTMTWWLQRRAANDIEGELRYLASAHGRRGERVDDLQRAVQRARNRPLFAGVRLQVGAALAKSMRRWRKTHSNLDWPAESGRLPWLGRGVTLYDEPPAVIGPE